MPRTKDVPVEDDGWTIWVRPHTAGDGEQRFRAVCCDCGLSHDMEFRVVAEGDILFAEFRMKRNERSTAQLRRHVQAAGS